MRDIAVLVGVLAMLPPMFRHAHIGVLLWCWTAMIVPNNFLYGFGRSVPFNKLVAVLALLVWLLSREPKRIPVTSTVVLLFIFAALGTASTFTAIGDSETPWPQFENLMKTIVLCVAVLGLINTKSRIDALLYTIALSLGFHGVAEGAKFLVSGGAHMVWGPSGSNITDNNHFALAMVAVLPIVLYLYKQAEHRLIKVALLGSSVLVIAAIMGTLSRGGLIGIVALGGFAFTRSKQKFRYVLAVIPLVVAAIAIAPERWFNRMDTIQTAEGDDSFMQRVTAWKMSTLIAMDNPVLGGGFHSVAESPVWTKYARNFNQLSFIPTPPPSTTRTHAAHSIYFQVLGDMGFVGLFVFLGILASSWRNATAVVRSAVNRPEWRWASDLAITLQYSLVAYMVSGAGLSLAYFEYMYVVFALLVVLRKIVGEPTVQPRWAAPVGAG